jgi:hypothetical protein
MKQMATMAIVMYVVEKTEIILLGALRQIRHSTYYLMKDMIKSTMNLEEETLKAILAVQGFNPEEVEEVRKTYPDSFKLSEIYAKVASEVARERIEKAWIPVSERLPADMDVVLVWSTSSLKPTVAFFFQNDWLYYSINEECFWLKSQPHIIITHWMVLPEPPRNIISTTDAKTQR